MTFDTYKERREHEAREKARERHIRKRMKKAGMNPDSQTDRFTWALRQVYRSAVDQS